MSPMQVHEIQSKLRGKSIAQIASAIKQGEFGEGVDALIALARDLRRHADEGERDFITFLRAWDQSGTWKVLDAGTFEKFIDRNHICSAERYRMSTRTLDVIPMKVVEEITFAASKEIAKIQDSVRREKAIEKTIAWTRQNGRPPSPQKTRELAEIRPIVKSGCASCVRLKARVAYLDGEVQRLERLVRSLGGDPSARAAKRGGRDDKASAA
jgi:hypothetical protein